MPTRYFSAQLVLIALLITTSPLNADRTVSEQSEARRLTDEAHSSTDAALRDELLRRAIDSDPDFAPARWARGELLRDGSWLPIESVQASQSRDKQVAFYEKQLRQMGGTPDEHLRLARWARKRGLDDQARFHWLRVLQADPQHREALGVLDLVWRDGRLLTADEARDLPAQLKREKKATDSWRRRLARWERTSPPSDSETDDPTLAEALRTIDEHAILPFERLIAELSDTEHPRTARRRQLAETFVAAMDALPRYEATASLVRVAVLAPNEGIRQRATEALTTRPRQESVPLLLSGLRWPIESRHEIRFAGQGVVTYDHNLYRQGERVDHALHRSRVGRVSVNGVFSTDSIEVQLEAEMRSRMKSLRQAARFQEEANSLETQIAAQNSEVAESNGRITPVLAAITGRDLGDSPRDWWDHWNDQSGYEKDYDRPVERTYDQSEVADNVTYYRPVPPRPRCECFAAGTPVWTNTGLRPIETLGVGDLVLSKDVRTGELSFRPVLETTLRKPSPLMEIDLGGEKVRATVGHPFWAVGHGWRMAKEVSPTDRLMTVRGPVEIGDLIEIDDAPTHNLVVEGNANYFVGESGLLAHDVTPRRPDRVRVAKR